MTKSAYDVMKSLESKMMTKKEYQDWVIDRHHYTETMHRVMDDHKFIKVAFITAKYEKNRLSINEYKCVMMTEDDEFDEEINDAENDCDIFEESDAIHDAGEKHPEYRNYFNYPHRHQIQDTFDLYSCKGESSIESMEDGVNFDLPVILLPIQKLHDKSLITKRKCKIYKTNKYTEKECHLEQKTIDGIKSMHNYIRVVLTDPIEDNTFMDIIHDGYTIVADIEF